MSIHRCRRPRSTAAPLAVSSVLTVALAAASPFAPLAQAAYAGDGASGGVPDPWADVVTAYEPGSSPVPGYTDPTVALGEPARTTGAGVDPGVVSPFFPAFMPSEIVSIGAGGSLVLAFDEPIEDDPANPWGIDLLVFGNPFVTDLAFPAGVVGALFSEGGLIDVSADGVTWFTVPDVAADGDLPTLGWLDAGPYDVEPGRVPSDFTRPVDPAYDAAALAGSAWPDLLAAYDGSGGGTGVDLATVGLSAVSFVRLRVPAGGGPAIEIDGVADVAPVLAADVDGDGSVGFGDLLAVLAAWGACAPPPALCPADVDGDGSVGFGDVLTVLAAWTS